MTRSRPTTGAPIPRARCSTSTPSPHPTTSTRSGRTPAWRNRSQKKPDSNSKLNASRRPPTSELRALDVVAEHLAHRAADLALGRVGPGAVEDARHEVVLAGGPARGGGERAQRRGAGGV